MLFEHGMWGTLECGKSQLLLNEPLGWQLCAVSNKLQLYVVHFSFKHNKFGDEILEKAHLRHVRLRRGGAVFCCGRCEIEWGLLRVRRGTQRAYVVSQRKAQLNDASLACAGCCLATSSALFITRGAISVAWFPGYQGRVTLSSGAERDP
ncbi:hypothetical protein NDU88_002784 [Pleurodeles waltl]|uniref:Uncharacterized protein n=1 Tax=Pleurodeles waltl TaxID=8319 RepID=A0AAV7KWF0_PLEWA|nr:hypothetical protein NDU88_002784 [Pleurodeles waltl]